MPDWRCPKCSGVLTQGDFAGTPPHACPHCKRGFDAPVDVETVEVTASVVGSGRPEEPRGHPASPSGPGQGPRVYRGRTIYMRLDNTGNGAGCSGCGCLLFVLFFALLLRACIL